MGKKRKDIKSMFLEALEKRTAKERAAYLDRVCGDDSDLRAEFESLLNFCKIEKLDSKWVI